MVRTNFHLFRLLISDQKMMTSLQLIDLMKKQTSPIKIKDYFTNPTRKIRQPAFVSIGFNHLTLNTFVKQFTHRTNHNSINFQGIREFIKSFTNNSPKLINTYEQFFIRNFKIQNGCISSEHFLQFFMKQEKQLLAEFQERKLKQLYQDMDCWTVEGLVEKARALEIAMDEREAAKIIKMINYSGKRPGGEILEEAAFVQAVKS